MEVMQNQARKIRAQWIRYETLPVRYNGNTNTQLPFVFYNWHLRVTSGECWLKSSTITWCFSMSILLNFYIRMAKLNKICKLCTYPWVNGLVACNFAFSWDLSKLRWMIFFRRVQWLNLWPLLFSCHNSCQGNEVYFYIFYKVRRNT